MAGGGWLDLYTHECGWGGSLSVSVCGMGQGRSPPLRMPSHNLDPTAPSIKAPVDRSVPRPLVPSSVFRFRCLLLRFQTDHPSNGSPIYTYPYSNSNFLKAASVQRLLCPRPRPVDPTPSNGTIIVASIESWHHDSSHSPQNSTPYTRETEARQAQPDTAPNSRRRHLGGLPVPCACELDRKARIAATRGMGSSHC